MTADELDALYGELCRRMTEIGEAAAPLLLARFALLAILEIDDPQTLRRLIDEAACDLGAAGSADAPAPAPTSPGSKPSSSGTRRE